MPRKGELLRHTDGSCTAKTRDGDLCKNPPMLGASTCRMHGSATQAARAKAQERIDAAADKAAAHLIKWMNDSRVPFNIRLAAAKDLLDRAHIGTDKNIQLELRTFEVNIEGLLIDVESDPEELARAIGPAHFVPGEVTSSEIEQP
jgi:hypothetical protein